MVPPRPPLTIALPWRLPNPPTVFCGREAERRRLAAAVARGPLTRVWGPSGLGKTSLVLDVLHRAFAEEVPRVLYVAMAGARDERAVMTALFRALQDGAGRGPLEWRAVLSDPVGASTVLLDVTDTCGLWLVLDDLEPSPATERLLALVERYGRAARWIAIHADPPAGLSSPGQSVRLGQLDGPTLTAVCRAWGVDPAADETRRALAAADGSPGRLEEALFGVRSRPHDALWHPDAPTRTMVAALAAVAGSLPMALLDTLGALPGPDRCRSLIDRGIIVRRGDDLCLATTARAARRTSHRRDADLERRLLDRLVAGRRIEGWMQALELAVGLGDADAAIALLDHRGETLMAEGYALRVVQCLAHATHAELCVWRWQAESSVGIASVVDPAALDPERGARPTRYAINALMSSSRWTDAVALSRATIARWADDPAEAEWVAHTRVLGGWALSQIGHHDDARRMLDAAGPIQAPRVRMMAEALRAHLLTLAGQHDRALEIGRSMWRTLVALPRQARRRRLYAVLHLFYHLNRLEEAEAVIREVVVEDDWALLPAQYDRNILILLAAIFFERGRLGEARRCAERALGFVGENAASRATLETLLCRLDISTGRLRGVQARLDRLLAETVSADKADLRLDVERSYAELALVDGRPVERPPLTEEPLADPRFEALVTALRALSDVRQGHAVVVPPVGDNPPEQMAWWGLVRAYIALLAGRPAAAELEPVCVALRTRGLGHTEMAVRLAVCEALLIEGRLDALPAAVEVLDTLAADSPRFRAEARFFAAAPSDDADWSTLATTDIESAAARRAAALAGKSAHLDRIDQLVVDTIRRRGRGTADRLLAWAGAPPGPAWSLDPERGRVEVDGGGDVDLGRAPVLRRLLAALAEADGAAGKEALVCRIWQVAEYHPLRHDNRLRVAVRKLRARLAAAGLPDAVLTLEDGYGLRPPVRLTGDARPGDADGSGG